MFTGLVEEVGQIVLLTQTDHDATLTINCPVASQDAAVGDSISINGCCLTIVMASGERLVFQAGSETLLRTNLGELTVGSQVNIERALKVGDRLGGHYVTGHIDGLGQVQEIRHEGEWAHFRFSAPERLCRQMAPKGSITVDGISLTLVDVTASSFSVALVPHTLQVTILGTRKVGDSVNLETDVLAKYVEIQLHGHLRPDEVQQR